MKPDKYDMLTCAQCGEYHPKSNHRKYFPSQTKSVERDSYYKQCERCERINKRYAYLLKKAEPTDQDIRDINITEMLYKELQARGHKVPSIGKGHKAGDESAIALLNKITKGRVSKESLIGSVDIEDTKLLFATDAKEHSVVKVIEEQFRTSPPELIEMLYKELHGLEPEELYAEYDMLRDKYAPQTGVGKDYSPIYDTAHSEILQRILSRIEKYEDELF